MNQPVALASERARAIDTAPDRATIELALVSHTNAGKTTLARTLLGRDIGEVRDAPHVTEVAETHDLIESSAGDRLRLSDTPGFGDSARLVRRLESADNPIGWLLREVWDRYRDRPLWCNQQAVRAAREAADVVLYLVSAAEDPRDAGYVVPEMHVLRWIGKPVIVLLNQTGPPQPADVERADADRWRAHLASFSFVENVLTLDAFARCWVQERVLLCAVTPLLPADKQAGYQRLVDAWQTRSQARFEESMQLLAREIAHAARDEETLPASGSTVQSVLRAVGVTKDDGNSERAMALLAERLDAGTRATTDRLIALQGLDGAAALTVLERLRDNYATKEGVSESRAALWSSVVTGALTGLKADLAAGGLTFGAGLLVGGVIGGIAGASVARGINTWRGGGPPSVRWSDEFLDGLVRSALLRYLAVAHYGRGRGRYVEGEAPAFWKAEVETVVAERSADFREQWVGLRVAGNEGPATDALAKTLAGAATAVLGRLYPASAAHC